MKKVISYIAILLGAALLVFAIALPTYVVPKGKVLPLDVVSTTPTEEKKGDLLDSAALAAERPVKGKENAPECKAKDKPVSCFIAVGVPLKSQRFTVAQEPSDKKKVTLEVGNTLVRTDMKEPHNLLSATIDRVTLDRETQMPVPEPISTFDPTPPSAGKKKDGDNVPAFARDGIQYQWPMGTDRKSYDYFDVQILKSQPIDFVKEEEMSGEKTYLFQQEVKPTAIEPNLRKYLESDGELSESDKATLSPLKLKFPAKKWGLTPEEVPGWHPQGSHGGEGNSQEDPDATSDEGPDVEMTRYYTVNRRINVEPETGVIVNGSEDVWMFYARDDKEAQKIATEDRDEELKNPKRTAMYFPGEWNDEARANQMFKAKEGLSTLKMMGTILPWTLGIAGLLLLVVGFMLHRERR